MIKSSRKTTSRNPIYPEGTFQRGDYLTISKMSGKSYSLVMMTLVYQSRKNQDVLKAAEKLLAFKKKEFKVQS